jgi:Tfp pilus assembly protein PilO
MKQFVAEFDIRARTPVLTVAVLAWLALNLALAFLVNGPRARRVTQLEEAVAQRAGMLSARADDVARLRDHHDRVLAGRTSLDEFYNDVLSTKQERLITFQKEIREIARKFNINMDTIAYPRESYPKDKVMKFSAQMPLTGSYENLRQFVDTVERSQNFIVIDSVQLASSKEGGVILQLIIQLSTFFVDEDVIDESAEKVASS